MLDYRLIRRIDFEWPLVGTTTWSNIRQNKNLCFGKIKPIINYKCLNYARVFI